MSKFRRWASYAGYWRRSRRWPSRLQRLYIQGDPTGEVRRTADEWLGIIHREEEEEKRKS